MSRSRPRRPADVRPEMNVTPLVDVVLVLLIIFMVVAPRLEQDVQVNLPGIVLGQRGGALLAQNIGNSSVVEETDYRSA